MPEYLSPGVYIEEVSSGAKPIEGVSTSNAGFVGPTERGPEDAKLVTSWIEFQRWFGSYIYDQSYLPHAVQGFFDNGGKRCFIARVTNSKELATVKAGDLEIFAIGRGAWGGRLVVRVMPVSQPNSADAFRLRVLYFRGAVPTVPSDASDEEAVREFEAQAADLEEYDNVTVSGTTNAVAAINSGSHLIRARWDGDNPERPGGTYRQLSVATDPNDLPNLDHFKGQAGPTLATALDETGLPKEFQWRATGFEALDLVDEVSLVIAPDDVRKANGVGIAAELIKRCEN